jgi:thymidylate kinase
MIVNIVLTGGACAGKTTAMPIVKNYLEELGYIVVLVEESATEVLQSWGEIDCEYSLQQAIMQTQIEQEALSMEIAHIHNNNGENVVVLYDRGISDQKAYCGENDYNIITNSFNTNDSINKRYDAVFHIDTVAIARKEFYTTENNQVRRENVVEAVDANMRTFTAWHTHKNHIHIENTSTLDDMINKLTVGIQDMVLCLMQIKELEAKEWINMTRQEKEERLQQIEHQWFMASRHSDNNEVLARLSEMYSYLQGIECIEDRGLR